MRAAGIAACVCALVWPALASEGASQGSGDSGIAGVREALARFLTAFENLDWEPFRDSFEDDATVFFPSPEPASRFEGRAAIEARFRQVFEQTRREAPSGPPYHRLQPRDLRIDSMGDGLALASFLLRNEQRIARRTILFRRTGGRWRIAHLHASNAPAGSPAR